MNKTIVIDKITEVIPNKYEAIRVIAKEARRINSLLLRGGTEIEDKPTMMALRRLLDQKIKYAYFEPEEELDMEKLGGE